MSDEHDHNRPLSGYHAVVTGGGRGIGAAIARRLGVLGANLTLIGRDAARLESYRAQLAGEFDQELNTVCVDMTEAAAVGKAFVRTVEALGNPLILINNVGAVESAPFRTTDFEHWRRMIDVNLSSVYHACQAVLPAMMDAGQGRIVNVASTAGLRGYPYVSAYVAAKHGVVGLTRSLALETARHGVTVNAVCPGYTDTDLIGESARSVARETGQTAEEVKAKFMKANPQGRFVEPGEVAGVVAWLCLPEQRSITGQTIVVDGGETA
jgi:NAD(P)-dependent dehydrogenase (short-subunit alcohol dehydrogenase family)